MIRWIQRPLHQVAGVLFIGGLVQLGALRGFAEPTKASEIETSKSTADADVKVDAATSIVIEGALKYLASQQLPDGSWSGDKANAEVKFPVAMTSYALIAFMANGNLPDAGPYAKEVSKGLRFLLDSVEADGMFREKPRQYYMYSHGLATMVLAEMYGETQDPLIRRKLERTLTIIEHSQNSEGGWRYQPGSKDADLSATVPQTVALCGAKRAGVIVPEIIIDRALAYIKGLQCGAGSSKYVSFSYQADKPGAGFARTAAAIYAIQISGLYDDPLVVRGSNYILDANVAHNNYDWMTYGNYYAAVALYLIGGDKWREYYQIFGAFLLKNVQTKDGMSHWDATMDGHAKDIGSNWCTAVFTTVLSLPYGYLPLYQR